MQNCQLQEWAARTAIRMDRLRSVVRLPVRLVAVDDEFGIGSAAKLVQIHAEALAV